MCYWPKLSVTVRAMVDQNQFKLYSPEADSLYGPPEPDYILVQSPEQLKFDSKVFSLSGRSNDFWRLLLMTKR